MSLIVAEIFLYCIVAVLVLAGWYVMPILAIRLAIVLLYLVFLRWAWRRGND
jgi:hypothetical protein